MNTLFVVSVSFGLATLASAGIYGERELTLDLSGGGGGGDLSGLGGHAALALGGGSLGGDASSLYSGPSSYETSGSSSGGGGGSTGDYHQGVSIIGSGGNGRSTSFDLTNQGWNGGHSGTYGGSFVSSPKYDGNSGLAHKISSEDQLLALGNPHYSDVLGASQDEGYLLGGGGGGGLGGYKW